MITAKEFFENFKNEYYNTPSLEGNQQFGVWTKHNLQILTSLGQKMGYNVKIEKPVRIDVAWFDPEYIDPQVAIEYETEQKGVLTSEIQNLAYSCAPLKVLITYVRNDKVDEFLENVQLIWSKRSRRQWNDELLVMIINYLDDTNYRSFSHYDAYVFSANGNQLTIKELGDISI